ncbi:MAG: glycosyltransferase, partial [Myxococcota bacterium]|nr:glycosyltransferase [Myxococcota bacterium]
DHVNLLALADRSKYRNRIHFPGEVRHDMLVDWYSHGDIFVYTSVSETFGNVVNEALWCGLPAVALNDRMGVAHQVADEVNGFLIEPNRASTDREFASACLLLTRDHNLRRKMSEEAANLSRRNAHPDVVLGRFESIYGEAHEHCRSTVIKPLSERSRVRQLKAFAHHVSRWSWYNGWLLAIAHAATRLGASRSGAAIEHVNTATRGEVKTQTSTRAAV